MTAAPLQCWTQSEQLAVRAQLDRILGSAPFAHSKRRQRFLEYIVSETLAGRGERLKGYNIAIEVFDRPDDFDPNIDPVVRIEAGKLRDKLREYYEADGQHDLVRIELPKGCYTPHIEIRHAAEPEIPSSAVSDQQHGANDFSRSGPTTCAPGLSPVQGPSQFRSLAGSSSECWRSPCF